MEWNDGDSVCAVTNAKFYRYIYNTLHTTIVVVAASVCRTFGRFSTSDSKAYSVSTKRIPALQRQHDNNSDATTTTKSLTYPTLNWIEVFTNVKLL